MFVRILMLGTDHTRNTNHVDQWIGALSHVTSACPFGSEGVLEMEFNYIDLLNNAYIMKSPYKLWSPNVR